MRCLPSCPGTGACFYCCLCFLFAATPFASILIRFPDCNPKALHTQSWPALLDTSDSRPSAALDTSDDTPSAQLDTSDGRLSARLDASGGSYNLGCESCIVRGAVQSKSTRVQNRPGDVDRPTQRGTSSFDLAPQLSPARRVLVLQSLLVDVVAQLFSAALSVP